MNEPSPPPGPLGKDAIGPQSPYQQILFETARALAESPTLVEAAPRMLEAVCEGLGWRYGALWEVDRARNVLQCVGMWQSPVAAIQGVRRRYAGNDVHAWDRPARSRVGFPPARLDTGRDPRREFPSRGRRRAGRSSRRFRPSHPAGTSVLGVMEFFSSDIIEPTPALLATITTVGNQIGLYIERKLAGEELDRFFELSPDLFCVATFDGYFIRVNSTWQRVLGFSEAELRASPFMEFIHPDDRAATVHALSALTTGGHVIDFENRYRSSDGSYKWLQWRSVPFPKQGSSTQPRAMSPNARPRLRRCASTRRRWSVPSSSRSRTPAAWPSSSRNSRSHAGAPSRRRWPKASSWRT